MTVKNQILIPLVLLLQIAVAGCASILNPTTPLAETHRLLKPITPTRDVIQIEMHLIDRLIGDPLMGEALWSSLSPISSLASENRTRLNNDGFQIAMSSANPSRALQALIRNSDGSDPTRKKVSFSYAVESEQETCLRVSSPPDGTKFSLESQGETREVIGKNSHCTFRLIPKNLQDDWVSIAMIPEIQHGDNLFRPTATNEQWLLNESQAQISLYQHRITSRLNVGEMIVIGLDPAKPNSLAAKFFRPDISQKVERLIVIRVVGVDQVQGVSMK